MSQSNSLTTPVAILLGSVIIGAGLYFGLQGRRGGDTAAPPGKPVAGEAAAPTQARPSNAPADAPQERPASPLPPVAAAPPMGIGLAPPSLSPAVQSRVNADVAKALEALKPELVSACWEPALKKDPKPAKSKYTINMSFDSEGREVARGISEVRGESRPDVAQCLRGQPMKLRIPAPGSVAIVEGSLSFP